MAVDSEKLERLKDKSAYDAANRGWYYGPGCFYGSESIKTLNIRIPKGPGDRIVRITK